CMGLSVSSTNYRPRYSFHLLGLWVGASVDGRRRSTATSQAAPGVDRRLRAKEKLGRACQGDDIAPHPCIRWMLEDVILEHPNHDAAMRIGGEAPRRRARSLPPHENHGQWR